MKDKKWIRFRHKVIKKTVYPLIGLYVKAKTHVKIEKYKGEEKGPFLIVFNHQTGYDQFIVSLSFKKQVYLVASDDLFSNGIYSKIIRWGQNPIPIKKNVSDIVAVKKCIKVAKEGGNIALSPEGNRTFSGETGYLNPAIAGLVKVLKLPLVIYKIEGGYNLLPRWADKPKKGKSRAYVKKIISVDELSKYSKDELAELINKELYQNDFDILNNYTGKRKAEYLERVAYVCPKCGLSTFESNKNVIKCLKCGAEIEYLDDKSLKGLNLDIPFKNYLEWYKYQENFVNELDLLSESKCFYEEKVDFYKVIINKNKQLIDKNVTLKLFNDRYEIITKNETLVFNFDKVSGVSVLGRNKLNVYFNNEVYQVKANKRFNAVKYLNFYFRYQNQLKENDNGFLGL